MRFQNKLVMGYKIRGEPNSSKLGTASCGSFSLSLKFRNCELAKDSFFIVIASVSVPIPKELPKTAKELELQFLRHQNLLTSRQNAIISQSTPPPPAILPNPIPCRHVSSYSRDLPFPESHREPRQVYRESL